MYSYFLNWVTFHIFKFLFPVHLVLRVIVSDSRRAMNVGQALSSFCHLKEKPQSPCTAAFSSVKGEVYLCEFSHSCSGRIK